MAGLSTSRASRPASFLKPTLSLPSQWPMDAPPVHRLRAAAHRGTRSATSSSVAIASMISGPSLTSAPAKRRSATNTSLGGAAGGDEGGVGRLRRALCWVRLMPLRQTRAGGHSRYRMPSPLPSSPARAHRQHDRRPRGVLATTSAFMPAQFRTVTPSSMSSAELVTSLLNRRRAAVAPLRIGRKSIAIRCSIWSTLAGSWV